MNRRCVSCSLRYTPFFWRRSDEEEVDDELREHIEMLVRRLEREGQSRRRRLTSRSVTLVISLACGSSAAR